MGIDSIDPRKALLEKSIQDSKCLFVKFPEVFNNYQ